MHIKISQVVCRYGTAPAVAGVDLEIRQGEFVALLGPSGSGKTTLLRILAGLETAESGNIEIDGQDALAIPPNRRNVGFVFQHYALFRHMTVARNIAFGLEIRPRSKRPPRAEIDRRVAELLDLVQLPGLGTRYPQQLSGGQRQRVALARALAIEPKLLLLDEPFGALDAKVRVELRLWLKALHRSLGITSVFVTHDQEEAMELADRVIVMRAGKLEQMGTPAEVYAKPRTAFVYGFLGTANRIPCTLQAGIARTGTGIPLASGQAHPDGPASAWFRPYQVDLFADDAPLPRESTLPATLLDLVAIGPRARISFVYEGVTLTAEMSADALTNQQFRLDQPIRWRPRDVQIYPEA